MAPRDYEGEKEKAKRFLRDFCRHGADGKEFPYRQQLALLAHRELRAVWVSLSDVAEEDPALEAPPHPRRPGRLHRAVGDGARRRHPRQ